MRPKRAATVQNTDRDFSLRAHDQAVEVTDDGKGFDMKSPAGGLGLIGMRERLALVDGTLEIESAPGRGTTVLARVTLLG